jgi:predicted alpha/beta-hydrolase family hydrolase
MSATLSAVCKALAVRGAVSRQKELIYRRAHRKIRNSVQIKTPNQMQQSTDHGWKHIYLGIHMETGGCDCSLRAPDDGLNNARNMFSSVYATKQ